MIIHTVRWNNRAASFTSWRSAHTYHDMLASAGYSVWIDSSN